MGLRGLAFIGSVPPHLCRKSPEFATRSHTTEPQGETRDLRRTAQERHPHGGRDRLPPARALPLAVWLDLTNLGETALRRQASDLNSVITSVRGYYATNVVGRVLANPRLDPGRSQLRIHPRRDPDPGDAVAGTRQGDRRAAGEHHLPLRFRFPVQEPRAAPARRLREGRAATRCATIPSRRSSTTESSLFSDSVRLVAPVMMGAACVSCHNTHPESPKKDWKVGDVRGIQEVDHRAADRREPVLVQVSAGLFRCWPPSAACRSSRCSAGRRADQGHEPGA